MNTLISGKKDMSGRVVGQITADFYIGSTATFDAHHQINPREDFTEYVAGVWNGKEEHTAIVRHKCANVLDVVDYAAFLATLSGNDFILVTFDTSEFPMTNLAYENRHLYGARKELTYLNGVGYTTGIKHIGYTIPALRGEPYTFIREPGSAFIAFLVNANGEISQI